LTCGSNNPSAVPANSGSAAFAVCPESQCNRTVTVRSRNLRQGCDWSSSPGRQARSNALRAGCLDEDSSESLEGCDYGQPFRSCVKPQPGDTSIVVKTGTLLLWYDTLSSFPLTLHRACGNLSDALVDGASLSPEKFKSVFELGSAWPRNGARTTEYVIPTSPPRSLK
jgi:hypothetical protein